MKCLVFYNSKSEENIRVLERVVRLLKLHSISVSTICVLEDSKGVPYADFAVSIGGDGTVLWASHHIVDMDIPLIAVKTGGLGFLSSVEVSDIEDFIEMYLNRRYKVVLRSMLKISYDGNIFKALNDCVIKSASSRMFYSDVFYSDELISSYFSDGLIFSTPTGSTAYNLSAFGPIVHPETNILILTPISSHTLTHRSLILPYNSLIRVYVRQRDFRKENIFVSIDGQINFQIEKGIEISFYEKKLKSIVSENYSYFDILRKKLSWGER
ncbi:MAG: NAD(+)/NADH kinase [Elusimicrobiales bacterium]